MELRSYLLLLRRRLVLIVLCVVAGAIGGYVVSTHSPTYQAQTSLLVSSRQADSESSDQIIQLDTIIATYLGPNKSLHDLHIRMAEGKMNFLVEFSEACRNELDALHR